MLLKLLRDAAAKSPERAVVVSPQQTLSYEAAVARAEALAAGLASRGIERFGVVVEDPAMVVPLLAGASWVGSEACVYPRDLSEADIAKLADRFDHRVIVSDRPRAIAGAETVDVSDLPEAGAQGEAAEAAPVMILTTGTTGDQKGARHDWGRLVKAVRHPDEQQDTRWLLAYNLNQFAGLQVMLHVLVSGATLIAARSSQARDVIEAMREGSVTHASATPTFWRLLVGSLDPAIAAELPVRQITLGGEAAPGPLIEKLHQLFPSARISHVYAGTEFGSIVSVRDQRGGLPLSVLDRGADDDVQMRIVDDELQIRSKVGMLGYHGADDAPDEWRSTGDLVEIRDDRIHFVGRSTEIINVGGAKVHPLPVEEVICSVDGVTIAAVYGRPNPITGQIVAADVVAEEGADLEQLKTAIGVACQALPRPGRPRKLNFVESLGMRGNKLYRQGRNG